MTPPMAGHGIRQTWSAETRCQLCCPPCSNLRNPRGDCYLAAMRMLWKNIKGLVGAYDAPPVFKRRRDAILPVLEQAWLAIEDGVIVDLAPWTLSRHRRLERLEVVDCEGNTCCLRGVTATPTSFLRQPSVSF